MAELTPQYASHRPPRRRVLIMGAAGRDFHNLLCCYRDDPQTDVVAFTAAQIPHIAERRYPASLAGPGYPEGIPIYPETALDALIATLHVDEVVFAYSDIANQTLMTLAQTVLAAGAAFTLLGAHATMLSSQRPVIAVCAVRTGCGKSAVTRRVVALLREQGLRPVVLRHPMPYGDEATINATPCDAVICGTPVDLLHLLTLHVPAVRVSYDIEEIGQPTLTALLPLLAERARMRHA